MSINGWASQPESKQINTVCMLPFIAKKRTLKIKELWVPIIHLNNRICGSIPLVKQLNKLIMKERARHENYLNIYNLQVVKTKTQDRASAWTHTWEEQIYGKFK